MSFRIVLLVLALTAAACGEATEPLATTTTTTTLPTTTDLPSTTATPPAVDGADLLVAHADGIDLWLGGDFIAVLEGEPAAAAFPDGSGGIVYQGWVPNRPRWDWHTELPEPILVWPGEEPIGHPIMWIPRLGAVPQILVDGEPDTWVELVDVTTLGDRSVVVYEREVSLPDSCIGLEDLTECSFASMRTRLTARDLDSGEEWSLGRSGSFEWRARAAIAGSRAAVNVGNIDYCLPAEMRVVDVSAMLALDPDTSITSVAGGLTIALGDACTTGASCESPGCAGLSAPALAQDGSSLAFLAFYTDCCGRPTNDTELLVWDIEEDRERQRIPLGPDRWFDHIDHDGSHTVVGFSDGTAILVDDEGAVTNLPEGRRYSLWTE